ncbi:MAG TPA: hypothetical protein VGJ02_06895, partial [Pyrinomonadaceae bacterium]
MVVLDVILIYIACGAPFVAASLLDRGPRFRSSHILASFAAVIYWPVLVPSTLRRISGRERYLSDSPSGTKPNLDEEQLRSELLDAWSRAFGSSCVNIFREKLERYTALSIELAAESRLSPSELTAISDHPDAEINSICLARRNRQKLELHRTDARIAFIAAVEDLASAG